MKLQRKLIIPIVGIVIIGFLALGIITYSSIYNGLTMGLIQSQMESQLENLIDNIQEINEVNALVNETVDSDNIALTKAIATIIASDSQMLETKKMTELVEKLGISEIHVIDKDGILQHGNVVDFYGFDFSSSDQTKPFLELINKKDSALAQEPSLRGTDNVLFQYIGVSRIDEPGIVQIGLEPSYRAELDRVTGIQNLIENFEVGKSGYAYVIDTEGIAIYHNNPQNVGLNIHDIPALSPILEEKTNFFMYEYNGEKLYASIKREQGLSYVASMPESDFIDGLRELIFVIAGIFIIVISIIIVVSTIAAKRTFKVIPLMVENMNKAGSGDLDVRMNTISNDELGTLSENFNDMIINVSKLIYQAKDVSNTLNESAQYLALNSQKTLSSTEDIGKTIEEIANGSTEQAIDVEKVAKLTSGLDEKLIILNNNSQDIAENALNVQNINSESTKLLTELERASAGNAKSSNDIALAVKNLEEKSADIGSIVFTISSIAEQTNLLALNASIEAARAGEHGRGFAVVAEEIRKLAEESSHSANQISGIVSLIQNETQNAVEIVTEVSKNAIEQSQSVKNINVSFGDISNAISDITSQIQRVDSYIKEILDDKDYIVSAIENISAVSEETAASSEEVSATTEQQISDVEKITESAAILSKLSKSLNDEINKFKL